MKSAPQIFNAHAGTYDAARARLIPPLPSFYETAVEALALAPRSPSRVLDLGAGTGLLSRYVRQVYPQAELVLVDGAEDMLQRACEFLGDEQVSYVVGDLNDDLPPGSWDAVVSSLAIHHLDDEGKRDLMVRVREALAPGGVFVNAEQVSGPSPVFAQLYRDWHEARARGAGSDDEEWAAAVARMAYDRCASVEDQLAWLRGAGFAEADCLFKDHRFAVMVALKAR